MKKLSFIYIILLPVILANAHATNGNSNVMDEKELAAQIQKEEYLDKITELKLEVEIQKENLEKRYKYIGKNEEKLEKITAQMIQLLGENIVLLERLHSFIEKNGLCSDSPEGSRIIAAIKTNGAQSKNLKKQLEEVKGVEAIMAEFVEIENSDKKEEALVNQNNACAIQ